MIKAVALTATTAALLGLSMTAAARTSSETEYRGYSECLAAAASESNGLVPAQSYFINKDGTDAQYFINATRWEEGVRTHVRIACETTARGARLVSAEVNPGIYRNQTSSVRVEVAQN